MWVLFRCCFDRLVDGKGDGGAYGIRRVDVAEAPDGFDFFLG